MPCLHIKLDISSIHFQAVPCLPIRKNWRLVTKDFVSASSTILYLSYSTRTLQNSWKLQFNIQCHECDKAFSRKFYFLDKEPFGNGCLILAGSPLWSRGNIMASHAVGPGSILGLVSFLVKGFFRGFPSTVRQMSGNLGHNRPRLSYGHHIIRLWTATVSYHSCSTWPSINNNQPTNHIFGVCVRARV